MKVMTSLRGRKEIKRSSFITDTAAFVCQFSRSPSGHYVCNLLSGHNNGLLSSSNGNKESRILAQCIYGLLISLFKC